MKKSILCQEVSSFIIALLTLKREGGSQRESSNSGKHFGLIAEEGFGQADNQRKRGQMISLSRNSRKHLFG